MFRLPREIVQSVEGFIDSLEEYLDGRMSPDRFKGIRVPWGIYSQRGGDIYMARIRIPAGTVTPLQLKALGKSSLKYGNGVLHATTRQDFQLHDVRIEDMGDIIGDLEGFNLSPRGGGGNTVRNITSCSFSGICQKEVFDVRGSAIPLTEFLLKDPDSYRLPRKYKIAFSGCGEDCSLATLSDLGFIAKEQVSDGITRKGFSVYMGGGMGAVSKVGHLIDDFIPLEDAGYIAEAVRRLFLKRGERKNRNRARLRFLVEKLGIEEFTRLFRAELKELKETEDITLREIEFSYSEGIEQELSVSKDKDFEVFQTHNVSGQKQSGYYTLGIRLPLGDISADKLIAIAEAVEGFEGIEGIEFRTAQDQNMFICNIRADKVPQIYGKLKELNLAAPYISTIFDPVSCQGASTCNLGICNSKGLSNELIDELQGDHLDPMALKDFNIRISGCPNSCGHHPRGAIGLHGLVRKVGARPVPYYRILLGGRVGEGRTSLAKDVGIVPAKNVPVVLKEFLTVSQGQYSALDDYLDGEGRKVMVGILNRYSTVPPYEEDPSYYRDFGKEEDFSLAGIGPGECGAGVIDLIESDLDDAGSKLIQAEELDHDVKSLSEALHLSARALLVVRGIEPKGVEDAVDSFLNEFVEKGIASLKFKDLKDRLLVLQIDLNGKGRKAAFQYITSFHQEVKGLYASMDSSFKFPKKER